MVVETAHAWRKSAHGFIDEQQEKIAGFPATPAGQKQVLDLVANIVASLPDEMGQGIYYWEPICVRKTVRAAGRKYGSAGGEGNHHGGHSFFPVYTE